MTWCNEVTDVQTVEKNNSLPSSSSSRPSNDNLDTNNVTARSVKSCPSCGHQIKCQQQAKINDLPGLPAGVRFDPTDQEIIRHLEGKVRPNDESPFHGLHPLIDEFIPTLEGENGICYTHPEKLPEHCSMEIFRVIWVVAALYMVLMDYYKVMAIHPNKITIPFRPLLGQVAECLNFPEPVYGYVDKDRNNAFVRVKTECGKSEFVFFGGEANTIQESQERAAQKAVQKMISHYGVRVNDFTADRARMYQLCSKLYKHKVVELCREKGLEMPITEGNLGRRTTEDVVHVTMNYVGFLGAVVTKTGAEVSPLETIWAEGLGFVAWLTMSCPHNGTGMECIYSDPCAEVAAARQKVAKRAVHYLVTQYNLEVIDANYGLASEKGAACSDLKAKFYHFKERLAARGDRFPEGDYVTPTSEGFQIPKPTVPPSAPLKRRSSAAMDTASSSSVRITEPLVSGIPELETVWKRTKFA